MSRFYKTFYLIIFSFFCFYLGQSQEKYNLNQITITESNSITNLINKKLNYNKKNPNSKGFTIQIYYGNEKIAYSLQKKYLLLFPNQKTYIKYNAPDWKVLVGKFKTRLNADKALLKIKKDFTGAIIIESLLNFGK